MTKWRAESGMSLVEATIILMVLATLTAAISPSIAGYVNDSRATAAKEDVEAIGGAIMRVARDTGRPCLRKDGSLACTLANKVDLLVSAGNTPTVTGADYVAAVTVLLSATPGVNWSGATNTVAAGQTDTMDEQFAINTTTPYSGPDYTAGGGPRAGLGWRGAYITAPITGDPWGFMYQASTAFLSTASDSLAGTGEGGLGGGWAADVIVLSSGANGIAQTAFGASGTLAAGDDVVFVAKGSSR